VIVVAHCRKTQLSVLLNNFCNLSCLYCYVGQETGKKKEQINLKFAKRGILDFFERYSSREIRFFAAGEPTLSFKMMRDIHDWVIEITDSGCRFELQTNGYFNRKIARWVARNIDICWISCDGMADIQNHYRSTIAGRPTSDIIEKNISFLSTEPLVLGCRATITPKNVTRQTEMVDYFKRLGVKAVMSDPMFASVSERDSMSQDDRPLDLLDYAKNFLEAKNTQKKSVFFMVVFLPLILMKKLIYSVGLACPIRICCRTDLLVVATWHRAEATKG
jgi:sulfatase maturation enzyme AslB (radical SAM superfamily)